MRHFACILPTLLLTACHTTSTAQWASACTAATNARCDQRTNCTNGFNMAATFGSGGASACLTNGVTQCEDNNPSAGSLETVSDLQQCATQVAAESCSDFFSNSHLAACFPAGQYAAGAGCGNDHQCASGYCAIALGDPCGVCATSPAAGDSCVDTGECGNQEILCLSGTRTCAAMGDVGTACSATAPCKALLSCVGASGHATCQPAQTTEGAACDPNGITLAECSTTYNGLTCNPNKVCVAQVQAALGQPCGKLGSTSMLTGCEPGATGSICLGGTCTARVALGGECTPGYSNEVAPCPPNTHCVASTDGSTLGTCAYLDNNGCVD